MALSSIGPSWRALWEQENGAAVRIRQHCHKTCKTGLIRPLSPSQLSRLDWHDTGGGCSKGRTCVLVRPFRFSCGYFLAIRGRGRAVDAVPAEWIFNPPSSSVKGFMILLSCKLTGVTGLIRHACRNSRCTECARSIAVRGEKKLREQMLKQLSTYIFFILNTAHGIVNVCLESPQYAWFLKLKSKTGH